MSNDLLITPASRKLDFKDSSANIDAKEVARTASSFVILDPPFSVSLAFAYAAIPLADTPALNSTEFALVTDNINKAPNAANIVFIFFIFESLYIS